MMMMMMTVHRIFLGALLLFYTLLGGVVRVKTVKEYKTCYTQLIY